MHTNLKHKGEYKNTILTSKVPLSYGRRGGGGREEEHLNKVASSLSVKKCLSGTIPHSLTANNT